MKTKVPWTAEEDQILADIVQTDQPPRTRVKLYKERLPDRSYPAAIYNRLDRLKLRTRINGSYRIWTEEERDILRQHVGQMLPHQISPLIDRTPGSIQNEIRRMGLPRREYHSSWVTPEIDQAIRKAYSGTRRGVCKEIAQQYGVPLGWVRSRAQRLGLSRYAQGNRIRWTPEEDEIVKLSFEKGGAKYIARRLRDAGSRRSFIAIENRIYQLGLNWGSRSIYNANEIGQGMGIDGKAIVKWINKGWLKGCRGNPSGLTDLDEPGRWMIKHKDIRQFLIENVNAYTLAKVDKYWFVATIADPS